MGRALTFFLFLISLSGFSQNWSAPGATWYYDGSLPDKQGYLRVKHEADTVINGITCDVLRMRYYFYSPGNIISDYVRTKYVYASNKEVFYYDSYYDQFYLLYDFNAQAGDSWKIGETDSIEILGTGYVMINSDSLNVIYPGSAYGCVIYSTPIIEKIGCVQFLFPLALCTAEQYPGWNLRCYTDDTGWSYHVRGQHNCTFISDEVAGNGELVSGPNPTNGIFLFTLPSKFNSNASAYVFDALGQLVMQGATYNENSLDLSGLADGVYYLHLVSADDKLSTKIIKVSE